jgi:hypothetical protein
MVYRVSEVEKLIFSEVTVAAVAWGKKGLYEHVSNSQCLSRRRCKTAGNNCHYSAKACNYVNRRNTTVRYYYYYYYFIPSYSSGSIFYQCICGFIPVNVFLLLRLCILIVCLCMATLTEVFPCFFLRCKTNVRVKPAKTGHGPHFS